MGRDGETCSEPDCISSGEHRGFKKMRRCPGSCQTPPISKALRAWRHLRDFKTWPVEGGSMDQAATFLDFIAEIEAAVQDAKPEE